MSRRSFAGLGCLICIWVAAPAHAAITSSNITAPASGTHYLTTDDNPPDVPLTGTTNGTTGDTVDVRCYTRHGEWSYNPPDLMAIPVAANGSFSTTMPSSNPYGTCIMRAVPHGLAATADESPFTGPTLTNEWNMPTKVVGGPNDGRTTDFYVLFQGSDAMNDYVSATGGGLYDTRLQYANGYSSAYLWYGNAALLKNENLPSANRSYLQVDGRNAFGPAAAADLLQDTPGLPELTFDASRDPATGNTTIHETDPIVVCPDATFPPTALSCPHFDGAGVQLERTYVADDGGRQVHITDIWRSTDNAAHTISAHYDQIVKGSDPLDGDVPVGVRLPWLGDFQTFTTAQVFPGPSPGAGSIFVRANNNVPAGGEKYPLGAVSFDVAPTEVRRGSDERFTLRDENISVPAGGTATVREDFVIGQTQVEVEVKSAALEDRFYGPSLSISSPANGSASTGSARTKPVAVTGSASDNRGVVSLTLNGTVFRPGADGTFSVPTTLALGSNTFTVVAKDAAGNSTTAVATVAYSDAVAPTVSGFTATPATFRVGAGATAVTAAAKKGTTFGFTLSEDAKVSINIARAVPGKRRGKRCVKPTKKLAGAKSCRRLVSRGTLRRTLAAGKLSVRFTGRIGTKKLAPGRYVATLTALDYAGHKSTKKVVKLRIVRR